MQANRKNGRCGPSCRYRTRAAWARLLAGISLLFLLFLSGCTQDSAPADPDLAVLPIVRPNPAKPNLPAPEPALPSQEPPPSQAVPAPDRKPNPQTLVVEVHGFQNLSGRCRLALYQNAKGFNQPKSAWAKQTLDLPEQGPVIWKVELEDAPESQKLLDSPTRWAVSAHHDQNNNDQLDKNAFGIPTEPYGFSNNPKRGFGPPKFDEACFSIGSDEPQEALRIEIRVQ